MKRWFFKALAALSLLICIATASMWVRSYWYADILRAYWAFRPHPKYPTAPGSSALLFQHYRGRTRVLYVPVACVPLRCLPGNSGQRRHWLYDCERWDIEGTGQGTIPPPPRGAVLGFHYRVTSDSHVLWLPDYAVAAASLVLPAYWATALLWKRRLRQHGLCPTCGYDLRASKECCPECGTPILHESGGGHS
jgi:hypothetical protein